MVHSLNVSYHRPAKLYDDLLVTACAVARGRAWFEVEQTVRRGEELLCSGQVKVACADRHTMKPVRMIVCWNRILCSEDTHNQLLLIL